MTELINEVRFYHYMSGVLMLQAADPLCFKCKAFANTAQRIKEGFAALESVSAETMQTVSAQLPGMLEEVRECLDRIRPSADAVGQKKAGNCRMPEGVCFIKLSKAIIGRI